MPETVPLYSDMTVSEYLMYMAGLRNIKSIESRVVEVTGIGQLDQQSRWFIGNLYQRNAPAPGTRAGFVAQTKSADSG